MSLHSNPLTPVKRLEDDELMGYIVQNIANDDTWQPLTTFGYPLTEYTSKDIATKYLLTNGLEVLLDGWQFLDTSDHEWYNCVIVEAKPDKLVIKVSDYGHPEVHHTRTIVQPNQQTIRHR